MVYCQSWSVIAWFVKRNAYPEFWKKKQWGCEWWPLDALLLQSIKWVRTLSQNWPELGSSPKKHNKSNFVLITAYKLKSVSSLTTICIRSFIHEINQQQPRIFLSLCIFFQYWCYYAGSKQQEYSIRSQRHKPNREHETRGFACTKAGDLTRLV